MGMFNAVRSAYSNYFTLQGRATRSEFWYFWLYQCLAYLITASVCVAISVALQDDNGFAFIIIGIFGMFHVIPNFTILVRRLHDSSKSGWWVLLFLLSGPGTLVLLIFTLLPSEGDNKYGANPHNIE